MTNVTQFYPTEVKVEMSTKSFIFEKGGLFVNYDDKKFFNTGIVKLICHGDLTVTKNIESIELESMTGEKISLPIVNLNLSNSNFRVKAKEFLNLISSEETPEEISAKKQYVENLCNDNLIELSLSLRNKEMFDLLTKNKPQLEM